MLAAWSTPVVISEHLYKIIPGPSGRWARFRRWLEDRYRRIGLPYAWPLVQRDRIEPMAVQTGGVLYVHPRIRQST
jgi:hypothetical protein